MVDSHGRSPIKQRITGENALHQSMMGNTFKCYQEDTFLIPFTMAITCDSVFTLICGDDFPLPQVRWRVNCLAPPLRQWQTGTPQCWPVYIVCRLNQQINCCQLCTVDGFHLAFLCNNRGI